MKFRDSVLIGVSILALCITISLIVVAMFFVIAYKDIVWIIILCISSLSLAVVIWILLASLNKWYYIDKDCIKYSFKKTIKQIDKDDIRAIIWAGTSIFIVPNAVNPNLLLSIKSKSRLIRSEMLRKEKNIIFISMTDKIEKLLSSYGYVISERYD